MSKEGRRGIGSLFEFKKKVLRVSKCSFFLFASIGPMDDDDEQKKRSKTRRDDTTPKPTRKKKEREMMMRAET